MMAKRTMERAQTHKQSHHNPIGGFDCKSILGCCFSLLASGYAKQLPQENYGFACPSLCGILEKEPAVFLRKDQEIRESSSKW